MYAEEIIDLAKNPLNRGEAAGANLKASGVNTTCGDHVRVYLAEKDGVIEDASWEGEGCAIMTATASLLTEEFKGKKVAELLEFKNEKLFELLGTEVGPARVKCATLTLETIHTALKKAHD